MIKAFRANYQSIDLGHIDFGAARQDKESCLLDLLQFGSNFTEVTLDSQLMDVCEYAPIDE